ncbi:DUF1549 and DUF1553 domain-containing protein [Planctomicrobium sp. SH527]|uniref:DUF1549 and DUF1553 domain-containing protein n=1 Tax=Planctomicrobium sp. SH527 TaxID=3448123 RepID=UPI003F5B9253
MKVLWGSCGLIAIGAFLCFHFLDAAPFERITNPQMPPVSAGKSMVEKPASTQEIPELPDIVDYNSQLIPSITLHCLPCHSNDETEGSLTSSISLEVALERWKDFAQSHSQLPESCGPPPTSDAVLQTWDLLVKWCHEGAYIPQPEPQTGNDWSSDERNHWGFQPLSRPAIPPPDSERQCRNPIDNFIQKRLRECNIVPVERANNRHLIRRLSYALTGLPPQNSLYNQYNNTDDNKLDILVEELLDDPGYGEHWARYWLDVARYADTNGYEHDGEKPLVWQYRDFVIRAFNDDLPYDQFFVRQIAGDLVPSPSNDDYIASGFLRLGVWDSEPDEPLRDRYDQINEIVEATSFAFLGLSILCARCHDHPSEPITSNDYYQFAALFDRLNRTVNGRLEISVPSASKSMLQQDAEKRLQVQQLQRQAITENSEHRAKEFRHRAENIEKTLTRDMAYRFQHLPDQKNSSRLLRSGNPESPGQFVTPGVPSILIRSAERASVQNRLDFANWLVAKNPGLLARVLVNRVWYWHFGRGLTSTPGTIGLSGSAPSHPELLEWLSCWFVEEANWSIKKLHRLIVHSAAYRMAVPSQSLSARAELFGEFSFRKLRAEEIYDSMHQVSGVLSRRQFGPSDQPMFSSLHHAMVPDVASQGVRTSEHRRAIYQLVKRTLPHPFLEPFQFPDSTQGCVTRTDVSNPIQAATLWEGTEADACATALAERLLQRGDNVTSDQQIQAAYQQILDRFPSEHEMKLSRQFLDSGENSERLKQFCLILFNLHEFSYVK